jgi:hypothetical protein
MLREVSAAPSVKMVRARCANAHLSDDETVAKMGSQIVMRQIWATRPRALGIGDGYRCIAGGFGKVGIAAVGCG